MDAANKDTNSRQRRRKKRMSREIDDYTNESLESPSSLPERIPLQEVVDGDKVECLTARRIILVIKREAPGFPNQLRKEKTEREDREEDPEWKMEKCMMEWSLTH